MPQDIRSKEKEVDPVSHFNKNPSVVTLKKKRPNLKENVISERSGAAQSSHHPYSPSPNNRFLSADIIKGLPPAVLRRTTPTHFPLCFASPAPPTFTAASCCPSTYLRTRKEQRAQRRSRGAGNTRGVKKRFTAVSSAASSFQAAGLFQGSAEKHVVCFMRQTRPQTQPNIN